MKKHKRLLAFLRAYGRDQRVCSVVFVVQHVLEVQNFCVLSDLLEIQVVPGGAMFPSREFLGSP